MDEDVTSQRSGRNRVGGLVRSRWAAIGAAVTVAIGGGGLYAAGAATGSSPATYVATAPCRVVDTRPGPDNVGPRATPLGAGETYSTAFVGNVGKCSIPANATAVVLSLAVANPTAGSYLTVFPTGGAVPLASNLNFTAGQPPVANSATVQIGNGGALSFFNLAGTVDVVADVSGYYVAAVAKTQSLVFGARSVTWYNPGATDPSALFNCIAMSSGVSTGVIPLNLPVGAVINSIGSVILDGSSGATYFVSLYHQRTTATGIDISGTNPVLRITGGGSSNVAVTSSAVASSGFTVTDADSYWLELSLGTGPVNGFCSATVNVTMP